MFLTPDTKGKHALWRYLAVTALTLAAALAAQLVTLLPVLWIGQRNGIDATAVIALLETGDVQTIGLSSTLAFTLAMLTFAAALAALLLGVRWLHGRAPRRILTTRRRFDLGRVAIGAILWVTLAGGAILLAIPTKELTWQFNLSQFLPLACAALLLIPVQVLAEEALFRGYWMQGFARITRHPGIALLLSSGVFMCMHLANPELARGTVLLLAVYFTLGLFFGALAILDDGLELGTGCHLGNNLFVSLILSSSDGAVSTHSILQTHTQAIVDSMWVLLAVMPAIFILLHLRYRFVWRRFWQMT